MEPTGFSHGTWSQLWDIPAVLFPPQPPIPVPLFVLLPELIPTTTVFDIWEPSICIPQSVPPQSVLLVSEYTVYKVQDPLYWLLFIGHNGVCEYERVHYNVGKRVILSKQEVISKVRGVSHKEFRALTGTGPSYTQGRVSELLSKMQNPMERSSIEMFPFYSMYYDCPIFLVNPVNRTYVVWELCVTATSTATTSSLTDSSGWESRPIVLYMRGNNFTVELNALERIRSGTFDGLVRIQSHDDPLLPIGKYTKLELGDMYSKVCASNTTSASESKKMTKQFIYDALYDKLKSN